MHNDLTTRSLQEQRISMQIRIYINDDGSVTITDLLDFMLPIAYALNPEDEKMKKFVRNSGEMERRK